MASIMAQRVGVSSVASSRAGRPSRAGIVAPRAALLTQAPKISQKAPITSSSSSSKPAGFELGFTKDNEVFVGRMAMAGFAASVVGEVLSGGQGALAQLSYLYGLPEAQVGLFLAGLVGFNLVAGLLPTAATFKPEQVAANKADAADGPLGNPKVTPFQVKKFFGVTDWGFTAQNELFAGRLAQLGFAAGLLGEVATGLGPLGQLAAETGISMQNLQFGLVMWAAFMACTAVNTLTGKKGSRKAATTSSSPASTTKVAASGTGKAVKQVLAKALPANLNQWLLCVVSGNVLQRLLRLPGTSQATSIVFFSAGLKSEASLQQHQAQQQWQAQLQRGGRQQLSQTQPQQGAYGRCDDLLQPEELGEDQPGLPAVLTPKASAVRAVKKNDWALRSVLKVFVVKVDPNYAQPWQKCPQRSSSGSAFVLDTEQRIIITNAHVVANAVTVYVRRPGNPKKWRSQVTCMGKQSDLALLTVPEDAFWGDDLRPLVFLKEVPELQGPISVAGYPVGGDSLSITKGIVSRVSMVRYSQSGRLLGIQIDAAINPGNSGGPAFADMQEGKVAGVAFSKNVSSSTDNIGYVIPYPIVEHFLSEYRTAGAYQGVCSPGFYTQPMENPAQQQYLQVPEGASGCIVVKLEPSTEAAQHLQLADVILEVEGTPIAADESVQFRDDERVDYSHVISLKHVGDALNLKILRQGQVRDVGFTLHKQQHLVGILHEVDCLPSYYVAGGLVFAPLSLPCMEAVYGSRKWRTLAPISVLQAFVQQRVSPSQQVVILVQVLSHEINHGYNTACCRSRRSTRSRCTTWRTWRPWWTRASSRT
ncbi:hypothetical protein COO60DRAFT_1627774 [Scenedesmus sp. NREL 46B-D3]|nr:hypothetical protein COO60DRAFT_1627774 [Scenedesmus sp. NREL 46B-D3]